MNFNKSTRFSECLRVALTACVFDCFVLMSCRMSNLSVGLFVIAEHGEWELQQFHSLVSLIVQYVVCLLVRSLLEVLLNPSKV